MRFLLIVFLVIANGCVSYNNKEYIRLTGEAQGTTFSILYDDIQQRSFLAPVDSILRSIDSSLSLYIPMSILSKFNRCDSSCPIDEHIARMFWKSCEIHYYSRGAFDPTVKPLVSFWGFGPEKNAHPEVVDSALIDSLLKFVGMDKVKMYDKVNNSFVEWSEGKKFIPSEYELAKPHKNVQLDFNAIAQGYTVDVIADYFEGKGVENYLVEIGGELRVRGKNEKGELWEIGIDKPSENLNTGEKGRPLQTILSIDNKSVATSGNYRKFYKKDGKNHGHIIDPKSGYPVMHQERVISATVMTDDCMSADGYATALMVMGLEPVKRLLEEKKNELGAFLIIADTTGKWKTFTTLSQTRQHPSPRETSP